MLAKKKSGQGQAILFDELITLIYPTLQIYEKFLENLFLSVKNYP